MKKILSLIVILSALYSCKCKKTAMETDSKSQATEIVDCPANAECTHQIMKDSSLQIEQGVTGKPVYTIAEKTGTTVYRYTMNENQDQQYVDGGYREEIIFELPSDFKNGTISGKEIRETKALFGVFCYCKGKAGYYYVGDASITKENNVISVKMTPVVEGQKVQTIKFNL